MNRRKYIKWIGAGGTIGLAGCIDTENSNDNTSDNDINVSEPEPPNHGTEQIGGPNDLNEDARNQRIYADEHPFIDTSTGFGRVLSSVKSYTFDSVDVTVREQCEILNLLDENENYTIQAFTKRYPDGQIVGQGYEKNLFYPSSITDEQVFSVDIDYTENVVGDNISTALYFSKEILSDTDFSSSMARTAQFGATNPIEVTKEGINTYNSEYSRETDAINYEDLTTEDNHPENGTYNVQNVEGGYIVSFESSTPTGFYDIFTEVPFYIPKRIYSRWKNVDRPTHPEPPSDRVHYVTESIEDGIASQVAQILDDISEFHGLTTDKQKIEFISTFVQSLPYALDPISTGFTDYSRYVAETLVDAKGDCVDTTILLSTALLESSIDCDVALLSYSPDAVNVGDGGHLAVGVSPNSFRYENASYIEYQNNRFYYIEPTAFNKPSVVPDMIDFNGTDLHIVDF